jgi:diaminopimelate epimerase
MQLHFYKYHGTGNDFIILDGWKSFPQLTYQQIGAMCDRHFGIGADGLMILRQQPDVDFEMLYYNSDGHPGSMCGNGSRCLVKFAREMGYCGTSAIFSAPDGLHTAELLENGWVSVSMRDVSHVEKLANGDYSLDTGSPHYIAWKNPDLVNVFDEGRAIRNSDSYKTKGINVNFVETSEGIVRLRTYERGVEDETLSCGTGITASVIAAAEAGKIDKSKGVCEVKAKGGDLRVLFQHSDKGYTGIRLEGPAIKIFEGIIRL